MRTTSLVLLVALLALGCGKRTPPSSADKGGSGTDSKPGAPQKQKEGLGLSIKDTEEVEKIALTFDRINRTGMKDERLKAFLDLQPTEEELAAAFPNHVEKVQQFYVEVHQAGLKLGTFAKEPDRRPDREVIRVEAKDARVQWVRNKNPERSLLRVLAPDVLIADCYGVRRNGGGSLPTYMKVKGRWVMLYEPIDLIKELKLPDEPD
jgi:hypothetical protein